MSLVSETGRTVGITSHGLWSVREDVARLLDARPVRIRSGRTVVDLVTGWGHKPTARRARDFAERHSVPYVAVEDGFLRSVKPGGAPVLSYVVDPVGIYYDAHKPSRLEQLICSSEHLGPDNERRGLEAGALLRRLRLSKYNVARSISGSAPIRILVVDQVLDDASIAGAFADATHFGSMLSEAIAAAGQENVRIKLHPETVAGRKQGHLSELASRFGVRTVDPDLCSWRVIEAASDVYTVSSQLGFEALLAGVPVTCFGVPFYAGWGLTTDRVACLRRTSRPTLGGLAAATLVHYARYLDPWTRELIPFEEAASSLAFLRDSFHANGGPPIIAGMSAGKSDWLLPFFDGPDGTPIAERDPARALARASDLHAPLVLWGSQHPDVESRAKDWGLMVRRAEDGFLRSAGLGAAFLPARSLVLDDLAPHYAPGSGLECLLEKGEVESALAVRAARLRAALIEGRVTKYSAHGRRAALPTTWRRKVLVVGQVEDDASVRLGAPDVGGNLGLLRHARERHPDAFLLYRPHPDVASGYRVGRLPRRESLRFADAIAPAAPIADLLDWCAVVETMTSLAGFEGLIRGRHVAVHGRPFYAGWGLTDDLLAFPQRTRRLTLDELVALSLIVYPLYLDPVSRLPCRPELFVARMSDTISRESTRKQRTRDAVRHLAALIRHRVVGPSIGAWTRRR